MTLICSPPHAPHPPHTTPFYRIYIVPAHLWVCFTTHTHTLAARTTAFPIFAVVPHCFHLPRMTPYRIYTTPYLLHTHTHTLPSPLQYLHTHPHSHYHTFPTPPFVYSLFHYIIPNNLGYLFPFWFCALLPFPVTQYTYATLPHTPFT